MSHVTIPFLINTQKTVVRFSLMNFAELIEIQYLAWKMSQMVEQN